MSANGRHRRSVSGAIAEAMAAYETKDEVVRLAREGGVRVSTPTKEKRKVSFAADETPTKTGAGKGGRKPGALKRKGEVTPTKEKKKKKKKEVGSPNSSGEICMAYRRTGKCIYGDKCIHKHISADEDSDAEDHRE